MTNSLTIALKEWNLLISDLLAGRQAILLRKGGILESNNEFELEQNRFLLYPTFIHQNPDMIKPHRRAEITPITTEPTTLQIRGYAEVARILQVPSRPAMDALSDLHLWAPPLIDMRFNYRAEKPLYLVIVRAFSLPTPITIPNTLAYAGCKSWVPLDHPIDITNAHPALDTPTLNSLIHHIESTFQTTPP